MRLQLLACLCAAALLLGACGDDDSADGATNEYTEAMAASMAGDEDLPFDQDDIDCLSVEFVQAIGGAEALEEEGITPDDLRGETGLEELGLELGDEEAANIAAAFGECDVSLAELVLAEAGDDVPPDVRDCIEENLDEEVLADFFARVLVADADGEQPPEELLEPLLQCF